jgi:hypothetical protein
MTEIRTYSLLHFLGAFISRPISLLGVRNRYHTALIFMVFIFSPNELESLPTPQVVKFHPTQLDSPIDLSTTLCRDKPYNTYAVWVLSALFYCRNSSDVPGSASGVVNPGLLCRVNTLYKQTNSVWLLLLRTESCVFISVSAKLNRQCKVVKKPQQNCISKSCGKQIEGLWMADQLISKKIMRSVCCKPNLRHARRKHNRRYKGRTSYRVTCKYIVWGVGEDASWTSICLNANLTHV